MSSLTLKPFFETIYRLRSNEEVILFGKTQAIDPDDKQDVLDYLEAEWDNECLEYPAVPPPFEKDAALWAAQTVYYAAQLLLYREQGREDIQTLLPPFPEDITAGAVLSADLCLRMLPDFLFQLKAIDPEDELIHILEEHLRAWHYSGIGYAMAKENQDFTPIANNQCALQLYADRVIGRKDKKQSMAPGIFPLIQASMGDLAAHFWKE